MNHNKWYLYSLIPSLLQPPYKKEKFSISVCNVIYKNVFFVCSFLVCFDFNGLYWKPEVISVHHSFIIVFAWSYFTHLGVLCLFNCFCMWFKLLFPVQHMLKRTIAFEWSSVPLSARTNTHRMSKIHACFHSVSGWCYGISICPSRCVSCVLPRGPWDPEALALRKPMTGERLTDEEQVPSSPNALFGTFYHIPQSTTTKKNLLMHLIYCQTW